MSGGRPHSRSGGQRRHNASASRAGGRDDWRFEEAIGYNEDGAGDRPRPTTSSRGRATSTTRGDPSNYATNTSRRRPTSRGRAETSRPTSQSRGSQRRSSRGRPSGGSRLNNRREVDSDYTYDDDGTANSPTVDDSDITPLTQQNVSSRRPSSSYEDVDDSADETDLRTDYDYTTDDYTEDTRPRRKRSTNSGAHRPKSRGRASTTARVSTSSNRHYGQRRSHKHRDYYRHDSRSGPRRGVGNRPPDPLITPEMLSSLSTSVSTSLRTGICKSYELLQQGSAAATAATNTLQSSLEEATRNLPSGEDVAENVVEALDKAEGGISQMLKLGLASEDQDVEQGKHAIQKQGHDNVANGKAHMDMVRSMAQSGSQGGIGGRNDNALQACLQPRPHEEILLRHSPARKRNRQSIALGGNSEDVGDDGNIGGVGKSDSYISDTTEETSMQVGDVEVVLPPSPERTQQNSSDRSGRKFNDDSMFGGTAYSSIDPTSLLGEGIADGSLLNASSYGRSNGAPGGDRTGNSTSLATNRFSFGGTKGGYPVEPSLAQQRREMESTSDDNHTDEHEDEDEIEHDKIENTPADEDEGKSESSAVVTDTSDEDGDIENAKDAQTLTEQFHSISSLRLQIETLQQTAALAQRGWEDARTTLDKERAELLRLQSELERLKDENIRLRERNTELEKVKEHNDGIVQKLNDDNEALAKELIEAISQQEALKHDTAKVMRGETLTTPERKDASSSSTPSYSVPFDEGKGSEYNVPLADNNASTPPAPLPLPPLSPGRSVTKSIGPSASFSTTSTPTESSEQAKARIRAERKARIQNRPKSRGRAAARTGALKNGMMTSNSFALETPVASRKSVDKVDERSKLPLRVEEAVKDWTIQEESTMDPSQDNQADDNADWADPDLDPSLFDLQSSIADPPDPPSRRQREPTSTPLGRKTDGKNSTETPATVAATPSPAANHRRYDNKRQLAEDPHFDQNESPLKDYQDLVPWSSIRSAPHHIVQPPRLFPDDLAKSNDSHAVMTYVGNESMEPNDDLSAAEFDAAYLTLDEANYRARYVFFVLNAMGKEAEYLLDDPRVAVSTTDATSRAWGDRLQLSYKYTDGAGQKLIWKVWVIPAGGFASSSSTINMPEEPVDSTTKKSADRKVRMLV